MNSWLQQVSIHLKPTGGLFATFLNGETDYQGTGWVYPRSVKYKAETIRIIAEKNGMKFIPINWMHPSQSWALFAKKDHDLSHIKDGTLSWNNLFEHNQ